MSVMTDQDWDIDVQDDPQPTGPKALRDAYERQKQEASELRKQLESLSAKVRTQEVSELLSSKGIPKEAYGLFPKDVEVTEQSVNEWVDRYGNLFGSTHKQETKEEETPTAAQDAPKVDEQQFRQMQEVASHGAPGTPQQDLEAMLSNPHLEKEVPFEVFRQALEKGWSNLK